MSKIKIGFTSVVGNDPRYNEFAKVLRAKINEHLNKIDKLDKQYELDITQTKKEEQKNNVLTEQIQSDIVNLMHTPDLKLEIHELNQKIKAHPNQAKEAFKDLENFVNDKPSMYNNKRLNDTFNHMPQEARGNKHDLKEMLSNMEFKLSKNNELYLYCKPEGSFAKTELGDASKQKEYNKGLVITGNIAPNSIEINKDKGLATYSIAVSQGKDIEPLWYKCSTFNTKEFDKLQNIKNEGKGSQVTIKGTIQKNIVEKDDITQYYTNIVTNSLEITKEFQKPSVSLHMKGTIFKELELNAKNDKEYAKLTVVLDSNNNKEYYIVVTSNKYHIENLKSLKKGASLKIDKANINPQGQISINKFTIVNDNEVLKKNKNQPKTR